MGVSLVLKEYKKNIFSSHLYETPQTAYPSSFPSIPQQGGNSSSVLTMTWVYDPKSWTLTYLTLPGKEHH